MAVRALAKLKICIFAQLTRMSNLCVQTNVGMETSRLWLGSSATTEILILLLTAVQALAKLMLAGSVQHLAQRAILFVVMEPLM
jgi:hypothetical protein